MTTGASNVTTYRQISASTNCNNGPGSIQSIFVSAASATPTITVYDSASTTTTTKIIDTFTPVAATSYTLGNGAYANGCYVAIGGTVSCTVFVG